MADAIKLSVTGDTQALVDAVKKGAVAVEDLQDVLKDAGKEGDRTGDQITDAMSDSQRDTKELKDDIKRATDEFEKAGRAGRDLGDNVYDGTSKAKDGIKEIGSEAASTATETAASFDGSAESIAGGFQEVAANAFAGFGPAGLLAGLAGAAGIGLVTAEIQKQQEETDALKERLAGLYTEAIDSGNLYITEAQILKGVQDLMFDATRVDEYNQAQKDAATLGLDVTTLLRARAGDESAVNDVLERQGTVLDDLKGKTASNDEAVITANQKQYEALSRIESSYGAVGEEIDANQKKVQQYSDIEASSTAASVANTKRSQDADTARYQGLADRINGIPSTKTVTLNIDTTNANRVLDEFTRRQREIAIGVLVSDKTTGRVIK